MYKVARILLTQPRPPSLPGGEAGDLVNVPVEEGVRLRVGDVEQLAGLGHVAGDPLVHRHADLVVAATLQCSKIAHKTGTVSELNILCIWCSNVPHSFNATSIEQ